MLVRADVGSGAAVVIVAALIVGILHPLPQGFDHDLYQSCMAGPALGVAYCCQQASGVLNGMGDCIDPASIPQPPSTVTITVRPRAIP